MSRHRDDYSKKMYYELGKAQTHRLIKDYDKALSKIGEIMNWVSVEDRAYIESWLCWIETDKKIQAGEIPMSEISQYTERCNYEPTLESETNNNVETPPVVSCMNIDPNPATTSVTITICNENANVAKEVSIVSSMGDLKLKRKLAASQTSVTIPTSSLQTGNYQVILTINEVVKETKSLQIVK